MLQAAEQAGPQASQKGSTAPGTGAAAGCPGPEPSGELLSLHDRLLLFHPAYKTPEASHTAQSPAIAAGVRLRAVVAVAHSSLRDLQSSMHACIHCTQ